MSARTPQGSPRAASRHSLACILPPDLLIELARGADAAHRDSLLSTLAIDQGLRVARAEIAARTLQHPTAVGRTTAGGAPTRRIYDQAHSSDQVPGRLVRSEGDPPDADHSVNQAYDNFGYTYALYWDIFHRDSIDDQGMPLEGLVHFGTNYDNAFYDGAGHMFFGDGDGKTLTDTTKGTDVVGHELTHGVTQHEANLTYSGQSGALNESCSDVFGVLVKQYHLGQSAQQADWLIGADIVGPLLSPALRSMKAPGTANQYDHQPATMDGYVRTTTDNGGVHTNSGIPNRAFYLVATGIGGNAWEAPGQIWYDTLADPRLRPNATFSSFAGLTLRSARSRYGTASREANAVSSAWDAVKVRTH
ncbi:M4 family metallopeptidase [Pseudarthrobacter niigatensis]|uniref:Neutral metalloproteinase n=1 Tax=Pseudarthrobacter niigatensis TaxID=369935 RepID=A0AAJ1SRV3_9MICC|nr:M4 family metallopeptidase [Pseudarthrobacter niigatensis]MDQ0144593.1 Zn-dependent metalloprotease [Pseudarthrobacter niigatensis]MDQ0265239.1 Zn-dependent metalloprotease [Pseudarthrobacter niigatensis]